MTNNVQETLESKSQVTKTYFFIIEESKFKFLLFLTLFAYFSIDENIFQNEIKEEQQLFENLEFNAFLTLIEKMIT